MKAESPLESKSVLPLISVWERKNFIPAAPDCVHGARLESSEQLPRQWVEGRGRGF